MSEPYALRLRNVSKEFGIVKAISDVSLEIKAGQAHALLGENGAGKSTIVKLLSGLLQPNTGSIEVFGEKKRLTSPLVAQACGIQTAFQEMTMLADLSVMDNMLLPHAATGYSGMLRRKPLRKRLKSWFETLDFPISLDVPVGLLSLAEQQKIEIARALWRNPKILLLDEPTSTLSSVDVDWLANLVAHLKSQNVTIIFISHRMLEVRQFCDSLSILRNGAHVATRAVDEYSDHEVIELIIGRSLSQLYPKRHKPSPSSKPVLELRHINAGKAQDINLSLRAGEIVSIAGLQGMGQIDVFNACFGLTIPKQGDILLDNRKIELFSPQDAIRPNIGIGFVPQDRKTEGLLLNQSGLKNASLPVLTRFRKRLALDEASEVREVSAVFHRLELNQRALVMEAGSFSGGNQQKIVLARWLLAHSRILLLFDPTRGIDIGAKQSIYQLMADFTGAGGSILFYSTEISEIVHLSDIVHVMYSGRFQTSLRGSDINETRIMAASMGHSDKSHDRQPVLMEQV